jgi:hypothetical protein
VHPASGNRTVDRQLDHLWKFAEFTPVVVGGCRASAWVHVNAAFNTEQQDAGSRMEVRVGP